MTCSRRSASAFKLVFVAVAFAAELFGGRLGMESINKIMFGWRRQQAVPNTTISVMIAVPSWPNHIRKYLVFVSRRLRSILKDDAKLSTVCDAINF